ncbi:unnamed protein product [Linum trigynum]|uniref:Uncharacterized protein n=1 Tax=Linum trigynum TaxID=586398 RepID=A0AAV2GLC8_9ROSI
MERFEQWEGKLALGEEVGGVKSGEMEAVAKDGSAVKTFGDSIALETKAASDDRRAQTDGRASGGSSGATLLTKLARLELPKFAGDDPGVCFSRVEQFFEY